jgi:hypothetical protein
MDRFILEFNGEAAHDLLGRLKSGGKCRGSDRARTTGIGEIWAEKGMAGVCHSAGSSYPLTEKEGIRVEANLAKNFGRKEIT